MELGLALVCASWRGGRSPPSQIIAMYHERLFEPAFGGLSHTKNPNVKLGFFVWLRIVEDVRTAIQENDGYISIPKLTAVNLV